MGSSAANNTRVALWIIAFFFGWPVIAWCALILGGLVITTDVGLAVAVTAQAAVATAAAWFVGGFAIRRGAPREIWIPVLIGSFMPVLIPASMGFGDFGLYRLAWPDTYLMAVAIAAAGVGPALAVWTQWRRITASEASAESVGGT